MLFDIYILTNIVQRHAVKLHFQSMLNCVYRFYIQNLVSMDIFDRKILNELQENNRISTDKLGQKIGLSATACQRRLKKLRQSNVITKEVAVLNGVELNNYVTVAVDVVIKQGGANNIECFKKRMLENVHVQQCFYVTGAVDFILIITAKSMLDYEKLTQKLFYCDNNIQKFHSTVVMENVKVGLNIPI